MGTRHTYDGQTYMQENTYTHIKKKKALIGWVWWNISLILAKVEGGRSQGIKDLVSKKLKPIKQESLTF